MGLYDEIMCNDELPYNEDMVALGLNKRDYTFQTKDLMNCLEKFVLQDSKLYVTRYKEEKWIAGDENADFFLDRIGHLERNGEYLELFTHTGIINMYDRRKDVQGKWDCWIEYSARFDCGVLKEVGIKEFRKTDNTERKKYEAELQEKLFGEENVWYNKYFLRTRPILLVRSWIRHILCRTSDFCVRWSYRI